MRLWGWREAVASRVALRWANGSTPLILAVPISDAMRPQALPPSSWPAKRAFSCSMQAGGSGSRRRWSRSRRGHHGESPDRPSHRPSRWRWIWAGFSPRRDLAETRSRWSCSQSPNATTSGAGSRLSGREPLPGGASTNAGLGLVEFGDAAQGEPLMRSAIAAPLVRAQWSTVQAQWRTAAIVTPKACLRHDPVTVEHFPQLAPGVCPATGHADGVAALAGGAREAGVARISLGLEDPVDAAQDRLGDPPAPVRGVKEHHPRRIGAAPVAVVAGQRPVIAGRRVEDAPPA